MSKSFRARVKELYEENPQLSMEEILKITGKKGALARQTIVNVQSELRGHAPDKRANHNKSEMHQTVRFPPPPPYK